MAEHVYDEIQEIELDSAGYIQPLNRSNQTPNAQRRNSIVKKTNRKRCIFVWIGIIIGSVFSGILIFSVFKFGRILSYDGSSCLLTEWTEWTGCTFLLTSETEKRARSYTVYAHNCQQNKLFETRKCNERTLDIRFDPTTLHSNCFLSDDHTILSNQYKYLTPNNPKAETRFQNYEGVMVTMCVEKSTSIYYEIYFQYVITSKLSSNWLVLELGIGERNKIDNSHFVGNSNVSGWAFQLMNYESYNKVCLFADHQPRGVFKNIKQFSNNTARTQVNGTFGIIIDRVKNKFSLIYNDTVLFTFQDVLSDVLLCPVFGVYNPNKVQVDLQIVYVGNMTYAP